jgi:hypothetical protein
VIDNVATGFSLHRLGSGEAIGFYETGTPSRMLPKQVVFAEHGKVVVGGSEYGKVHVFDRVSSSRLATLHHAKGGMVQTVTVSRRK